jgi:hypothetical protein
MLLKLFLDDAKLDFENEKKNNQPLSLENLEHLKRKLNSGSSSNSVDCIKENLYTDSQQSNLLKRFKFEYDAYMQEDEQEHEEDNDEHEHEENSEVEEEEEEQVQGAKYSLNNCLLKSIKHEPKYEIKLSNDSLDQQQNQNNNNDNGRVKLKLKLIKSEKPTKTLSASSSSSTTCALINNCDSNDVSYKICDDTTTSTTSKLPSTSATNFTNLIKIDQTNLLLTESQDEQSIFNSSDLHKNFIEK